MSFLPPDLFGQDRGVKSDGVPAMTASPITHRLCPLSRASPSSTSPARIRCCRALPGAEVILASRAGGEIETDGITVRRAAPARRDRALRHHLRARRVRRHRQGHAGRGVPARDAPAGGRRALCDLGVHRLAGPGRGRAAARQARRLSLGLARPADRVRRDPRRRPGRARRQCRHRRRRHRRHRFRLHPGGRDRRRRRPRKRSSLASNMRRRRRSMPALRKSAPAEVLARASARYSAGAAQRRTAVEEAAARMHAAGF